MKRRHRISRFRLTPRSAEIYEYISKRYILLKLLLQGGSNIFQREF